MAGNGEVWTGKARELKLSFCLLFTFLFLAPDVSSGAKFLLPAISLMSSPSHFMGLSTLTRELVQRGHEVTLLLLDRRGTAGMLAEAYTDNITYPNSKTDEELSKLREDMSAMSLKSADKIMSISEMYESTLKVYDALYFGCFELFGHNDTLKSLKQKSFDMILSSPVVDTCDSVLSAYLDVPFTVITGTRRTPVFSEDSFGIPIPSSYVPFSLFLQMPVNMTFWQRVGNLAARFIMHPFLEYVAITLPVRRLQEMYDIRRDLTPKELLGRAELWLCHTTFALDFARPIAPNWIPVAGYIIKPPKPLPQDLNDFIGGSGENGFIIFTLGSLTQSLSDETLTNAIAKVFSELKQRVVWRYVGPTPENVGNNTLISKWLPQNDLLAHPKARLLIYHGGSAGVHEAAYHGVPMIIMPLFGDHPSNAAGVEGKGLGVTVDKNTLDEDTFRRVIMRVLEDPSFKANAVRVSEIFHDDISKPLDRAIFWIEHVVKYGGGHLRSRATELGFIQLYSLDVFAFLLAICLAFDYLVYIMIVKCCCRRKSKQKAKVE